MDTLLLDQTLWDFVKDASGNIAMATKPYALAQDVSSAARLFSGELWYDTSQGIPYFDSILGVSPPTEFLKAQAVKAALTVPEVVEANAVTLSFIDGNLSGQIQFSDKSGTLASATISNFSESSGSESSPLRIPTLDVDFVLDFSVLS